MLCRTTAEKNPSSLHLFTSFVFSPPSQEYSSRLRSLKRARSDSWLQIQYVLINRHSAVIDAPLLLRVEPNCYEAEKEKERLALEDLLSVQKKRRQAPDTNQN